MNAGRNELNAKQRTAKGYANTSQVHVNGPAQARRCILSSDHDIDTNAVEVKAATDALGTIAKAKANALADTLYFLLCSRSSCHLR